MGIVLESLGIDRNDPEVTAAREDFDEYADLVLALVARRKALGITQKQVAAAMHTGQSAVSAIEATGGNPTIRRLQRYARAVGARLILDARDDAEFSGVETGVRWEPEPCDNVVVGPWRFNANLDMRGGSRAHG